MIAGGLPGEGELLRDLGARAADAEPGGALVLVGQGEDLGDARVAGEEFAHEGGAVALAGTVEEDDVAGEAVGAAGGEGAIEDGLNGGEGFVVGEVSGAAHDALLEEPGAGGIAFHVGVVIGFDGEDVDAAEAGDEFVGDAAEIGGETDAVVVAVEEEAMGALFIVGEADGFHADAADGLEGGVLGEAGDELVDGRVRGTFEAELFLCVEGFAGFDHGAGVVVGAEDADVVFEEGLEPVGIEVVGVEVGEDHGLEVGELDPGSGEALAGGAGAKAGVDEERAPGSADDGGVAGRSAAKHA